MATTMVNFRMDEKLKKNMEKTCKKMGLTMSAAFNVFATKVVQTQSAGPGRRSWKASRRSIKTQYKTGPRGAGFCVL